MDPYSGVVYDEAQLLEADEEIRERVVRVEGKPEHIQRISDGVAAWNLMNERKRNKARAKNKRAKASRKRNRS